MPTTRRWSYLWASRCSCPVLTYLFLRAGSWASAGWAPIVSCTMWVLLLMSWSFLHPLLSILSSMYHSFILMMPQVMPIGSCPLTLSLLRDSLSAKWSPSFITIAVGVVSSIWFIGLCMVWRTPLGSLRGTSPALLSRSPNTGSRWGLVRGLGTVPLRMPLTLHLILSLHSVPQHCLSAGSPNLLVRTLSDLF